MDKIIKIKTKAKQFARENGIKTKAALEFIAQENEFSSWKDYKNSLDDFWYQKPSPFLNHWFAQHRDALEYQSSYGGFLLTYKGQYFVAEKEYIAYLGLDPYAPIWEIINFDVSRSNAVNKLSKVFKTKS